MADKNLYLILSKQQQLIGRANRARWPLEDNDRAKPQKQRIGGKLNLTLA